MENVSKLTISLFALSSMLWPGGCALNTRHVGLSYPPPEPTPAAGVGVVEAAEIPRSSGQPLILVELSDVREEGNLLGRVRNGFGMKMGKVVAEDDVKDWIMQALLIELEEAGYDVTTTDTVDESVSVPILSGEIQKVRCGAYLNYEGEVILSATLLRDGREVLARSYIGEASSGTNWAASAKGYGNVLGLALQEALERLVADIDSVLGDGTGALR